MLYRVHLAWTRFKLTMLVVIGIDYIGSYKPNYQTITMAPNTPEVSMLTITPQRRSACIGTSDKAKYSKPWSF
jgi:hypothetical protein